MQGILMTPENHKKIRLGIKTQTRRLDSLKKINEAPNLWKWIGHDQQGRFSFRFEPSGDVYNYFPRYKVGEVVYIKEAWAYGAKDQEPSGLIYKLDGTHLPTALERGSYGCDYGWGRWVSPLFMPAKYARDFIQITDVRAERLQEITEGDALAEGVTRPPNYSLTPHYIEWYKWLWDSINKKCTCDKNPFVWRIEFQLKETRGQQ